MGSILSRRTRTRTTRTKTKTQTQTRTTGTSSPPTASEPALEPATASTSATSTTHQTCCILQAPSGSPSLVKRKSVTAVKSKKKRLSSSKVKSKSKSKLKNSPIPMNSPCRNDNDDLPSNNPIDEIGCPLSERNIIETETVHDHGDDDEDDDVRDFKISSLKDPPTTTATCARTDIDIDVDVVIDSGNGNSNNDYNINTSHVETSSKLKLKGRATRPRGNKTKAALSSRAVQRPSKTDANSPFPIWFPFQSSFQKPILSNTRATATATATATDAMIKDTDTDTDADPNTVHRDAHGRLSFLPIAPRPTVTSTSISTGASVDNLPSPEPLWMSANRHNDALSMETMQFVSTALSEVSASTTSAGATISIGDVPVKPNTTMNTNMNMNASNSTSLFKHTYTFGGTRNGIVNGNTDSESITDGTDFVANTNTNTKEQKKSAMIPAKMSRRGRRVGSNANAKEVRNHQPNHYKGIHKKQRAAHQALSPPSQASMSFSAEALTLHTREHCFPPVVRTICGKRVTIVDEALGVFVVDLLSPETCELVRSMTDGKLFSAMYHTYKVQALALVAS